MIDRLEHRPGDFWSTASDERRAAERTQQADLAPGGGTGPPLRPVLMFA